MSGVYPPALVYQRPAPSCDNRDEPKGDNNSEGTPKPALCSPEPPAGAAGRGGAGESLKRQSGKQKGTTKDNHPKKAQGGRAKKAPGEGPRRYGPPSRSPRAEPPNGGEGTPRSRKARRRGGPASPALGHGEPDQRKADPAHAQAGTAAAAGGRTGNQTGLASGRRSRGRGPGAGAPERKSGGAAAKGAHQRAAAPRRSGPAQG